jgi:hypothetical protein
MLKYAVSAGLVLGLLFLYDRGMLPFTNTKAAKASLGK